MQLAMSEQKALQLCATHNVAVSVIERLPGGGVRLVCSSAGGADILRQKAELKVLKVEQAREKHRPATPLW